MRIAFELVYDGDWRLVWDKGPYWTVKPDFSNIEEAVAGLMRVHAQELVSLGNILEDLNVCGYEIRQKTPR